MNKRKISDARTWLTEAFTAHAGQGRILLLSGPSGAGKTAVVRLLAAEMNAQIHEWINPVNQTRAAFDPAFNESIMRAFKVH